MLLRPELHSDFHFLIVHSGVQIEILLKSLQLIAGLTAQEFNYVKNVRPFGKTGEHLLVRPRAVRAR